MFVLGMTSSVQAQSLEQELYQRSLLLRAGHPESPPARRLRDALAREMGGWHIASARPVHGGSAQQRVADAQPDLDHYDVVVWHEARGNPTYRLPERIVVMVQAERRPRAFAIDRRRHDWAERAARVIHRIAQRVMYRAVMRARGIRSRWFSRMPRNGWSLRFAGFAALSPRLGHENFFGESTNALVGGGILHVGRWLTRYLRLDLRLHVGQTEDDLGAQSGLGMQLALVSPTFVRMGVAVGVDAILVNDVDQWIADDYRWLGVQASFPMEIGFDFSQRAALVAQLGPTLTKPPEQESAWGMMVSLGFEIDLGASPDDPDDQ